MEFRKFTKTEDEVSLLGFGAMRFPVLDGDNEKIDEEKAEAMIKHAINNGINYLDTAWPYHTNDFSQPGFSEPFLGRVVKENNLRDKVKIATKLPAWLVTSRESMDEFLNDQLKRLETDHIDYYLLHSLNKTTWGKLLEFDVFDFIEKAKASGKIKHIGFSFHDELPVFKEIVDAYDKWEFCQIQYNYFDTDFQAGEEGLNYAYDRGLSVIIMEPLRGGSLCRLGEEERAIFDEYGLTRSFARLALEWIYNNEKVSLVLSGMTLQEQLEENIATTSEFSKLTEKELEAFTKVRENIKNKVKVPCTKCGYCTPCPVGVDIPKNFTLLNGIAMFPDNPSSAHFYKRQEDSQKASNCIECRKCESHCPQHIEISQELKKVVAQFEGK